MPFPFITVPYDKRAYTRFEPSGDLPGKACPSWSVLVAPSQARLKGPSGLSAVHAHPWPWQGCIQALAGHVRAPRPAPSPAPAAHSGHRSQDGPRGRWAEYPKTERQAEGQGSTEARRRAAASHPAPGGTLRAALPPQSRSYLGDRKSVV